MSGEGDSHKAQGTRQTVLAMFKKFADRVNEAAAGLGATLAGVGNEKVRQLQSMGFDVERSREALRATDGDTERAAELLLASGGGGGGDRGESRPHPPSAAATTSGSVSVDEEMRRAMEASRIAEEERQVRTATEASTATATRGVGSRGKKDKAGGGAGALGNQIDSAAGMAAARRAEEAKGRYGAGRGIKAKGKKKQATSAAPRPRSEFIHPPSGNGVVGVRKKSNGLSHHPNVKIPTHMQDKSKEEQILRCADRLKPHPSAVDTLLMALTAVRDDPSSDRYRKVNKGTVGYQRTLKDKPGAEDMFLAMSFKRRGGSELVLERSMVDPALLYLGISALEGARASDEYKKNKRKEQFVKEVKSIQLSANESGAEALRRAEKISQCPSEPQVGKGALVQVTIADDTIRRRFDGDDVLRDVLNWIGGHGSAIPDMILSREWCLLDLNRYPIVPLDTEKNYEKTLQFLGCWPSGKLEILPSTDDWRSGNGSMRTGVVVGSSRGLGAAPSSELH